MPINLLFPIKWKIGVLMFIGVAINYLDRVNISHAIVKIKTEFGLSSFQEGLVLSGFSFGYVIFMIPGGLLIDKLGPEVIILFSVVCLSLATIANGLATGFIILMIIRILTGIFEAPVFPGNTKIVSKLFRYNEKSRAIALFDVGSYVGSALAAPLIVLIIIKWGWRYIFFISGMFGLIWAVSWYYVLMHFPSRHATATLPKRLFFKIQKEIKNTHEILPKWYVLLRQKKIAGMCYGFFCYNYLKSFFLTWLPTYLISEKGFSFMNVGAIALIPPFCAILGETMTGVLTDSLIRGGTSITIARKLPLCMGMLLSSIIIAGILTNTVFSLIIILSLSYTFLISASVGIWAIPIDIAPSRDYVGIIGGIQNAFSNIAGIVAPIITGYLFSLTGSFYVPLIISGLLAVSGAASYWFIVGKLDPIKL